MVDTAYLNQIRDKIALDDLPSALEKLRTLLDNDPKKYEALHQSGRFYGIQKQIRLGLVSHTEAILTQNQIRFGLLEMLQEIEHNGATVLPQALVENLVTDRNRWVESLQREFLKNKVTVSSRPDQIIQHFGWLIEEFLRKMQTSEGQAHTHRAFSYMTEAWQSSLRYLCYIQMAQLLKLNEKRKNKILSAFISMSDTLAVSAPFSDTEHELGFDYLSMLLVSTDLLSSNDVFMPEITGFVRELTNTESELFATTLFLDKNRQRLLSGNLPTDDESLSQLIDEYRTGLLLWLRKISFLVKYRLVSIKEINLNYRLGTTKQFVHIYGELHGVYNQVLPDGEDYNFMSIEDMFTYSQSVLLFKGNEIQSCLQNIANPNNYISLSPLLIDQSVFSVKKTDTPEVYYYTGYLPGARQYLYAHYKNELPFGEQLLPSNKTLYIKSENSKQPKLNDLFEQLEIVFNLFKT